MPGLNRTGPRGQGALTGRGLGFCGRGLARGLGRGFGPFWGVPQQVVLSEQEEKKILEQELEEIGLEKKEIEKRLKELK